MTTEQNQITTELPAKSSAEEVPRFEDLHPELQETWLSAMRRCGHADLAESFERRRNANS